MISRTLLLNVTEAGKIKCDKKREATLQILNLRPGSILIPENNN